MTGHDAPLRLGVLGCADIARRRTVPAVAEVDGVKLAAVASRDAARAAATAAEFGCAAIVGYDTMLASPSIDAVYIPLPATAHAAWIEQALTAGKHVLAEKPLTTERETSVRLMALARERGLVLLENMTFLHHAQHTTVPGLLADGKIGQPRDLTSVFTVPPLPEGHSQSTPGVGGGALLEQGVYPIRAAVRYLGEDLRVLGAALHVRGGDGMVVSGRVLGTTPQGVTADLRFGVRHSYRSSCAIAGSTGRLVLEHAFTPPASHRPVVRIERQDHREEVTLRADHQFANLITFFAAAVRGIERGEPDPLLQRLAEGSLRQAELIAEIEEGARRITV
jgi:NDP-hexose-3-ketoreductase